MREQRISLVGTALVCLFILGLGGFAHAQTGQAEGQPMMQQQGMPTQVSDAELEKVAAAYLEIHEIRMDLQETMAGVSDPESAQQMQEQAGAAMVQAVQDNGLNVDTYNQFMQEVQVNTELQEQLAAKLERMQ